MNNSKIIKILSSLEVEELLSLHTFLQLDIAKDKQPEELLKLFEFLQNAYPAFDSHKIEKQDIYKYIFGTKDWVSGKLDKVLTRFLKAVYLFISVKFADDIYSPELVISRFLQNRNLNGILDRVLNKWEKDLKKDPVYSSKTLYEHFLIKEFIVFDQSQRINPKIDIELPNMLKSLDQFYIFTKLKYACQLLATNLFIIPVDIQDSLKSFEHLDYLIDLPHLQHPIIQVYHAAYKMLSMDEEFQLDHFEEFRALLYENDDYLSLEQQKSLHTLIRSFAILRYHKGEEAYLEKVFNIYLDHLERGFLYYEDKIHSQTLRNLVTFGLRLKKYEWVNQFLQDHQYKISGSEVPVLIYDYNMALYYYHIKEYDKALNHLPDNFVDAYYKVGVKRLEIIIYYELDFTILDAKMDAFKIFVYRMPESKITLKHKEANNNFIHMLKQIRHPKTEVSPDRIKKLIEKISSQERIADKDWLLSILKNMQKPQKTI